MPKCFTALLLRVAFSVELEKVPREVAKIARAIRDHYKPAMHTKRAIAFVVVTRNSPQQLMDRLRPVLDSIGLVENYWVHTAPVDVVGRDGKMDSLTVRVAEAWDQVWKLNKSQNVGHAKGRHVRKGRQDAVARAPIEVHVKAKRVGQSAQEPNSQKPEPYLGLAFGSIEEGIIRLTQDQTAKMTRRAEWSRKRGRHLGDE